MARARVLLRKRRYVVDAEATARVLVDMLAPDCRGETPTVRHPAVALATARARRAKGLGS